MTPEDLSACLLKKGIEPDIVQDVIVAFLAHPPKRPRGWVEKVPWYPVAWALKVAWHIKFKHECLKNQRLPPEVEQTCIRVEPNALRLAMVREELDRVMANPLENPKSHRPRGGGVKGWREDYQALLRERQPR